MCYSRTYRITGYSYTNAASYVDTNTNTVTCY
jgi:hypothetical protein